jgi:hypothetical protein
LSSEQALFVDLFLIFTWEINVARRKSAGGVLGLAVLLLIGLPCLLLMKITDSLGPIAVILGLIATIGLFVAYGIHKKAARLAHLTQKYGSEALAQQIMQKRYWQGQTSEQLRDSLGPPVAIDHALLKTRKREIWKYEQRGKNRFGLRITLDDDFVAGWEHRHQ